MKTTLTIEESARLIELGVNASFASKHTFGMQIPTDIPNVYRKVDGGEPIFTLTDLLSILPKEIEYNDLTYGFNMWVDKAIWYVEYVAEVEFNQWDALNTDNFESPELIDALNQLAIYCLENGHLKTEKK